MPSQKALYVGGGCSASAGYNDCSDSSSLLNDLWVLNLDAANGGF